MKERKRKITVITVIGIMLFSCVATLSYALWERLFTQSDENKITTLDCFDITYENESAATTLNGAVPIKEEEGLKLEPYKITIKNTCDTNAKYNVILNKKKGSNLDNKFVRTAVDKKTILLSEATQIETRKISNYEVDSSYIIGSGFITGQQTKTIEIRSWMDWETQANEGQNKTFTYKITIETGATNENPPLGDAILANNDIKPDSNLDFTNSFPNSSTSSEDITNKSGIYLAMDDDGISYYFRGKVDNNYVSFAGYTWRIVRINGDGTVRLILNENEDGSIKKSLNDEAVGLPEMEFNNYGSEKSNRYKFVGYTYDNYSSCTSAEPCKSDYAEGSWRNSSNVGTSSNIKSELEEWYNTNLKDFDNKIALTTFCNDTSYGSGAEDTDSSSIYYSMYGPYKRIYTVHKPDLHCPNPTKKDSDETRDYGGVYKLKIGLINADEIAMAGLGLYDEESDSNYLYHDYYWWTMSPSYAYSSFAYEYGGALAGIFDYQPVDFSSAVLPVINLNSDVTVTGSGTVEDPYIVQ